MRECNTQENARKRTDYDYYICNMTDDFEFHKTNSIIWCPEMNADGTKKTTHFDSIKNIKIFDRVLIIEGQTIVASTIVTGPGFEQPNIYSDKYYKDGWAVTTDKYSKWGGVDIKAPQYMDKIKDMISKQSKEERQASMFDSNGNLKQGVFISKLEPEIADIFIKDINANFK